MGYQQAMEFAGTKIIAFEEFGSYQGDWLALVEWRGERGWIHGYYGSCSGCDAYEAEFGFRMGHEHGDKYISSYDILDEFRDDCETCQDNRHRHIEFAKPYLEGMQPYETVLKECSENLEWDSGAQEMIDWLAAHKDDAPVTQ